LLHLTETTSTYFQKGTLTMLTMQVFHQRLFSVVETVEPFWSGLAQVTKAEPGQLASLQSTVEWSDW